MTAAEHSLPSSHMNAKLFINYRREDTAPYAGRLYDRLTAHFSEDQVFMDIDQIEPGEDFVEVINRKVGTCDIAIVAIGPNWLHAADASGKRRLDDEEDFVRMEIVAALQRNIRVIPVLVDRAQMPRKQDLPEPLAPLSRRNAIELSETRFHADVNRLIEVIERSLAVTGRKAELSATPAAPPPESASARLLQFDRELLLFVTKWTMACLLGEAVGRFRLFSDVSSVSYVIFRLGLSVPVGVAVGFTQWVLLRGRIDYSQWWILLTTIGYVIGGFSPMRFITYNFLRNSVSGVYQAVAVGTMQWLVLRRSVSRAAWWILIVSIGGKLGFSAANAVDAGALIRALAPSLSPTFWGAIQGAVSGVITGFGLAILLQRAGKGLGPLKQESSAQR
jgi:TIR domain